MNERAESTGSPERQGWSVRTSTIVAGLLVPIAVQIGLMTLAKLFPSPVLWSGNFSSQVLSSLLGLAFLARQFRWWVLVLAIVYLPLMFGILVYLTFNLYWIGLP